MIAGPYLTQSQLQDTRDGSYLKSRIEALPRYLVPEGVLGLLAAVDVQSRYFDVLVIGFGFRGEKWVVDSFQIRDVDPKACIEDWNQITDRVVNATYRVSEQTELRIHATGVDSGGSKGVTTHAYKGWVGSDRCTEKGSKPVHTPAAGRWHWHSLGLVVHSGNH